MRKPLDVTIESKHIDNKLLIIVSKPNPADGYFVDVTIARIADLIAEKYVDEFYSEIKHMINADDVQRAVSEKIVELGIMKLKESR